MRVISDKYNNQTVTTTHRMITVKKHFIYRCVEMCPSLLVLYITFKGNVSYVDSDFMEEAIIDTHSKGKV